MAGTTGLQKPDETKSLPGSFEDRAQRLTAALKEADILPAGDVWVTDTFDTSVVACVWSTKTDDEGYQDYERHYYQVEISAESAEAFEFGAIKEVEKEYTERLVDVKGKGGARTKVRSPFALKSITPADDDVGGWNAVGAFSVFDYEDHSKDIVRKGSTKDSTAVHLPKILDHHGVTVGQSTKAGEIGSEFVVEFRIYPTRAGEDLVKLMQPIETDLGPHAPVEQGSIGFSPLEGGAKRRQGGGWEYTKLWIWEVSPVTFGDNDATSVGLVKNMADVNAMPTADLLDYAGRMIRLAVDGADGAKALYRRRLDDDRPLTDAQWKAIDGLEIEAAEALLDLVTLKSRAGKAASNAHLRHMQSVIAGLVTLIHGPAESVAAPAVVDEPAEEAKPKKPKKDMVARVADSDDGDGAGAGGDSATPATDQDGAAEAGAGADDARTKALRERELILAELGLSFAPMEATNV